MADELINHWKTLTLTDEEDDCVDLGVEGSKGVTEKLQLSLVGRVVVEKPVHPDAFQRTMKQIWSLSQGFIIRNIEPNLFIFQFFHWRDKEQVLEGAPWCFDQHLVVLKEMEEGMQLSEVELNHSMFWLRIYDLPVDGREAEDARAVAKRVGSVLTVDEVDAVDWDWSHRVRVLMDIRKPLRRAQKILDKKGKETRVLLKYERLPIFCYGWGLTGHVERDCPTPIDEGMEKPYGAWLRASPLKGRSKAKEEVAALRARKRLEFQVKPMKASKEGVPKVRDGEGNCNMWVREENEEAGKEGIRSKTQTLASGASLSQKGMIVEKM